MCVCTCLYVCAGLDYIFGEEQSDGNLTRRDLEALVMIQSSEYRRTSSFCATPADKHTYIPSEVLRTLTPTTYSTYMHSYSLSVSLPWFGSSQLRSTPP